MNTRDLLLALLRYAIKGEALDSAVKESLDSGKYATLFKVAKNHDVAHIIAYALEKNNLLGDDEVSKQFIKEMEQAVLRYEMMVADLKEIYSCFDNENIDYIPLKGAVIRKYYPQEWMRSSCDMDILIHEKDLERAVQSLVNKLSYKVDGKKNYHDISLISPFGMHLELHFNIKENISKFDKILTRVWEFSSKSQGNMHLQSEEFLMFHLVAHSAYHYVGGGSGLRSVLDLWMLEGKLNLQKDELEELLIKGGLLRFYKAILDLSHVWFDSKERSELSSEIEKYILVGGVYGTRKQGGLSSQLRAGGKFKYFMARIFMKYDDLAILYPVIKKHKVLVPFCHILRWFRAIFKSKKLAKEAKFVIGSSSQELLKMKNMLEKLGL